MILITGGHGLLGSELYQLMPDALRPTKEQMNVVSNLLKCPYLQDQRIFTVVHCAGMVNRLCENNRFEAMKTNIIGTANVAILCRERGAKMVYISSEYVFRGDKGNYATEDEKGPITYYGETKLAGESITKSLDNYLIIRPSFMPSPFPYPMAYQDIVSSKMPLSSAAGKIVEAIKNQETGTIHICGKRQSIYDYAKELQKDILPTKCNDQILRPKDSSMVEN